MRIQISIDPEAEFLGCKMGHRMLSQWAELININRNNLLHNTLEVVITDKPRKINQINTLNTSKLVIRV